MSCHVAVPVSPAPPLRQRPMVVALVGNPNVGKSSLFNALTGLRQRVGNWPGKTVERRDGYLRLGGRTVVVTDLPGSYSLEPYSLEESVTRRFLLEQRPDLIVDVVDALHLERNLYLTAQLLELGRPMVVALTMVDAAEARGAAPDPDALAARLGVPVVPVVANTGRGLARLLDTLAAAAEARLDPPAPPVYPDPELEALIRALADRLAAQVESPPRRAALALLQEEPEELERLRQAMGPDLEPLLESARAAAPDGPVRVADARYAWAAHVAAAALQAAGGAPAPRAAAPGWGERLDLAATHPLAGPLLAAAALASGIWAAFRAAEPVQHLVEAGFVGVSAWLAAALAGRLPPWAVALVTDGLLDGLATVALFAPLIASFFLFLGLLEDSGYLARAAFVLDRLLSRFGLQGRAGIGLFIGYGCNVPAVMAARTAASSRSRLVSILVSPLVICSARLVVIGFLASAFFPGGGAAWVMAGLYGAGLGLVLVSGWLFSRTLLRGEEEPFLMELPPYRLPSLRGVALYAWQQTTHFLHRAATVIAPMAVLLWALAYFPSGSVEASLLGSLGRLLEPLGRPLGFDWRMIVSLMSGFLAKEATLPTLAVLFASGSQQGLVQALRAAFAPPQAAAYLVFYAFYTPCLATAVTIAQEAGGRRWALVSVVYSLLVAGGLAWVVRQGVLRLWPA